MKTLTKLFLSTSLVAFLAFFSAVSVDQISADTIIVCPGNGVSCSATVNGIVFTSERSKDSGDMIIK